MLLRGLFGPACGMTQSAPVPLWPDGAPARPGQRVAEGS
jgi:hypothetical protein